MSGVFFLIWSSLAEWNNKYSGRSLFILICGLSLVGIITRLEPTVCLETLSLIAVWIGFYTGGRHWSDTDLGVWIVRGGIGPYRVVWANMAASGLTVAVNLIAATPLFILMSLIWGLPAWHLVLAIACVLASTSVYAAIGQLTSLIGYDYAKFIGLALAVFIWIFSALIDILRWFNPFLIIRDVMLGGVRTGVIAIGCNLALGMVIPLITGAILWWRERGR